MKRSTVLTRDILVLSTHASIGEGDRNTPIFQFIIVSGKCSTSIRLQHKIDERRKRFLVDVNHTSDSKSMKAKPFGCPALSFAMRISFTGPY